MVTTLWTQADDAYTAYTEQTSGTSSFDRIQFFIRPPGHDKKIDHTSLACGLCFEYKLCFRPLKKLKCQHSYHKECLEAREDSTQCIFCA